jgi:hypothetical protein
MKLGLTLLIAMLPFSAMAEGYTFKVEALEGEIHSYDLRAEQAQVVMKCQFIRNGQRTRYTEKRPYTKLENLKGTDGLHISKISIKSTTVWDYLPGYKLHNCSFNILIFARNLETGKLMLGDFIQLGQMDDQMSEQELKDITNTRFATDAILALWNPMVLRIDKSAGTPVIIMDQQ